MTNEDGTVWIVFNGEIYNYQELRPELEKKGHIFRGKSDTETIIHAYEEYGVDCVKKLNGMFGFALWDEKKNILFAVRDHIGVKPLYYAVQDGTFYFGSEIKAILAHPHFKKELNENGISLYLTFSCLPGPETLFKDIKKLEGGHYLQINSSGNIGNKEYWNPLDSDESIKKESEYIEEVRSILEDSIKKQMVSDVPFGCFLSGGIDSSVNAALMTKALGKPVETFSVGSEKYEKYNELQYSRSIAKRLNANTHEILLNENHLYDFIPKYAYHADDPNGDQVCLPLYWLSKLTRESGTIVVQIGEGSDELFAGYETYLKTFNLYTKLYKHLENLPTGFKRMLAYGNDLLSYPKLDFYKEYLWRFTNEQEPYWGNAIAFGEHHKQNLLTEEYSRRISKNLASDVINTHYQNFDLRESKNTSKDFLKRMIYLELKERLPELLLMRADKMIMAHSVEGRVPFLDKRLIELALNIPSSVKIKNQTPKYILKKSVAGIIPDEIIYRKKQGFGTPMSEWLEPNTKTGDYLINIIQTSKLKNRDFFNYNYINYIINAHQQKGINHTFRLWNLITLSLWYDYWFK